MAFDPSKISEDIASTWRSSPLVIGMQLVMLVMVGSLIWDRHEQRQQVTPLVQQMLAQMQAQTLLLANCYPDRPQPSRDAP